MNNELEFFGFPTEKKLCQKWLEICDIYKENIDPAILEVWSDHFNDND